MSSIYSSDSSDNDNLNDNSLELSSTVLNSEMLSICLREMLEQPVTKPSESLQLKEKSKKNMKDADQSLLVNRKHLDEDLKNKSICLVTEKLNIQQNFLTTVPLEVSYFINLQTLDLSNNNLHFIDDFLSTIVNLQTLYVKNNFLGNDSLPKDLNQLTKLRELNLSGNKFTIFPPQIYKLNKLKYLYLGNNEIAEILPDIKDLQNLQVLSLGGNKLKSVPAELGELPLLGSLALCDNNLKRLPRPISKLPRLQTLLLHRNNICCLPVEIVKLRSLKELSIRDNPLVHGFVNCCAKDLLYNAPSLLELAARVIKLKNVTFEDGDIPRSLISYLNSGQRCVNPKCKGMYFTSCVEHIKFVDFCGMYRVPLMHYLCSSRCTSNTPAYYRSSSESDSDEEGPNSTLKKILLG